MPLPLPLPRANQRANQNPIISFDALINYIEYVITVIRDINLPVFKELSARLPSSLPEDHVVTKLLIDGLINHEGMINYKRIKDLVINLETENYYKQLLWRYFHYIWLENFRNIPTNIIEKLNEQGLNTFAAILNIDQDSISITKLLKDHTLTDVTSLFKILEKEGVKYDVPYLESIKMHLPSASLNSNPNPNINIGLITRDPRTNDAEIVPVDYEMESKSGRRTLTLTPRKLTLSQLFGFTS